MFDAKKQLTWKKVKVGLVLTLALLILFFAVFFAGNIESFFSPKIILKAQIRDVKGLKTGAPVWLSGIEVGNIKSIYLDPVHGTSVTLSIRKSAQGYIKKDSAATILTIGLLGDKYIELSPGTTGSQIVAAGDTLKGSAQVDMQEVVGNTAVSIEKITSLIGRIEKGEGTLSKFITDPGLYNNLEETSRILSALLKDVKNAKGTLGLFVEDPSLYNKITAAASSMEELSSSINKSSGTLKKFVEDPTLFNRLLAATASMEEFAKRLNESQGTVKRLMEDPELYENLAKASMHLSSILEGMDKGNGAAGKLLKDDELAKDLKETVSELKEIAKDIKGNPKKYFKFSLF